MRREYSLIVPEVVVPRSGDVKDFLLINDLLNSVGDAAILQEERRGLGRIGLEEAFGVKPEVIHDNANALRFQPVEPQLEEFLTDIDVLLTDVVVCGTADAVATDPNKKDLHIRSDILNDLDHRRSLG